VRGNINATHRIELSPTARVFGDLHTREVIINAGSVLEGRCTIEPPDRATGNTAKAESTE
jgi:cytoskeletal protein CcmA (bactofilin family)